MTSQFDKIKFDLSRAESEIAFVKAWLAGRSFFSEKDIVSEINGRPHMCCLLASVGGIHAPDLVKFELTLKGLFRTDLVLGNSQTRQFLLVEFEDAQANSIFSKGANQYRHWSRRLEHGIGQVTDWAWLRADAPNETVLLNPFGGSVQHSAYIVICGRDDSIKGDLEQRRFAFRQNKMTIEGAPVMILTYDGMVVAMDAALDAIKSYAV